MLLLVFTFPFAFRRSLFRLGNSGSPRIACPSESLYCETTTISASRRAFRFTFCRASARDSCRHLLRNQFRIISIRPHPLRVWASVYFSSLSLLGRANNRAVVSAIDG